MGGKGIPMSQSGQAYATKYTVPKGTRVLLKDAYSNSPLIRLAIALELKIEEYTSYTTQESTAAVTFPFDKLEVIRSHPNDEYIVRGMITDTGNKFSIPDPVEGFPSKLLVSRLNLLRS